MPIIYEGVCRCGHKQNGHAEDWAVELQDGSLAILGHPCEENELGRLGFTWEGAISARKLFVLHHTICQDCGARFDVRRPARLFRERWWVRLVSALVLLFALAVVAIMVELGGRFSVIAVIVVAALLMVTISDFSERLIRNDESLEEAEMKSTRCCPQCKNIHVAKPSELLSSLSICPACKERSLEFKILGIS